MRKRRSRKDHLQELAKPLFARHPEEGGERILNRLLESPAVKNDPDMPELLPDVRTVSRWKAEFIGLPERVQAEYLRYRWPDTHYEGLLPWEASRVGLAIRRALQPYGRRPTIRQVKWAYWLTLSAPGMPWSAADALEMSGVDEWHVIGLSEFLAASEVTTSGMLYHSDIPIDRRVTFLEVVEDYLSWEPWRDKPSAETYRAESTVRPRGPTAMLRLGSFSITDRAMVELGYDLANKPFEIGMPVMQGVHPLYSESGRTMGFSVTNRAASPTDAKNRMSYLKGAE